MDKLSKFGVCELDIKDLINNIFDYEDDVQVNIAGTSNLDEGITGLIIYVDCIDSKNTKLNLVVKHSSTNVEHRKFIPIPYFYKTEVHVYETILPTLQNYLASKNVKPLDCFPKYYKSKFLDCKEMMVLENLKPKNFILHSVRKPMDLTHIKLLLSEYAILHSTSYAARLDNPELWNNQISYINDIRNFLYTTYPTDVYTGFNRKYCEILETCGEMEWYEKIKKIDFVKMRMDMVFGDEYAVLTHDDCWNNNYLFKYEGTNIPKKVAILDWQCAFFTHLEVDLAELLFSCLSSENLKHIDNLLDFYYDKFSQNLSALGTNPNEKYPKSIFLCHWKTCAKYGIIPLPFLYAKSVENQKNAGCMKALLSQTGDIQNLFDSDVDDTFVNNRIIHLLRYLEEKELF